MYCVCIYQHYLCIVLIFMNIGWLIKMVGVVVEGLGCSATVQFHLTVQPSSDTTPWSLILKNRLK